MDYSEDLASLMAAERTHNIFDMGAPTTHHHHQHQQQQPAPYHFNSTLPALNSSMRFEPHPDPPPSAFHNHHHHNGFTRHTPSPHSRSRSRSRPPSSASTSGDYTGVGPQRTTRARRNGSVSSTSPPPYHHLSMTSAMGMGMRPNAIVIPGTRSMSQNSAGGGTPVSPWYPEYALPTPESIHSHPFSQPPQQQAYNFGITSLDNTGAWPTHHGSLPPALSYDPPPNPPSPPASIPSTARSASTGRPSRSQSLSHTHHNTPPTSATLPIGAASPTREQTAAEKQLLLASEKRRRRRESHNAVERRRRDNINEKISELATLIPECILLDGVATTNNSGKNDNNTVNPTADGTTANGADVNGMDDVLVMSPVEGSADWSSEIKSESELSSSLPTLPLPNGNNNDTNNNGFSGFGSLSGMNGMVPGLGMGLGFGLPGLPGDNVSSSNEKTTDNGGNRNQGVSVGEGGVVKANKGMILRKSVEYIKYLQQLVTAQGMRNRELEAELRGYRSGAIPPGATSQLSVATMMSSSTGSSGATIMPNGMTVIDELGPSSNPLTNGELHSHPNGTANTNGGNGKASTPPTLGTMMEEDDDDDDNDDGDGTYEEGEDTSDGPVSPLSNTSPPVTSALETRGRRASVRERGGKVASTGKMSRSPETRRIAATKKKPLGENGWMDVDGDGEVKMEH